ncbi:hypothetical protein BDY19DRAFT_295369 [Irpex rosettiformis]|uniref:Uncharacterized protein n=1 Tax=Irpex rosettiformis TaxID=378272 RepID=A0ACB8UIC9_9APHY|nr:hypothetical protein BDY19DRAFT_295369 [Irpex rosettiformis]
MQLTLQSIKHKEVVDSLNLQLTKLEANSELQETILELQEKNEDLERLLQEKNGEIEENDDRFIQNNKDKKKLTAKAEALMRKVKALQEKLEKLEASSEGSTPKAMPSLPAATSEPPLLTPVASSNRPAQKVVPATAVSSLRSRSATGPATVSRPKTPEAIKSIFRSRTPEMKRALLHPLSPAQQMPVFVPQPSEMPLDPTPGSSSSSSVGKKRRAPDDFDEHESLPVQSFSVESAPIGRLEGAKTPRGSRKLGFTPMRGGSSSQQPASPPRRAPTGSGIIADVTNSPRSKSNPLKKGWLKMKPGSTQASNSRAGSASTRPPARGDRAQNLMGS